MHDRPGMVFTRLPCIPSHLSYAGAYLYCSHTLNVRTSTCSALATIHSLFMLLCAWNTLCL